MSITCKALAAKLKRDVCCVVQWANKIAPALTGLEEAKYGTNSTLPAAVVIAVTEKEKYAPRRTHKKKSEKAPVETPVDKTVSQLPAILEQVPLRPTAGENLRILQAIFSDRSAMDIIDVLLAREVDTLREGLLNR